MISEISTLDFSQLSSTQMAIGVLLDRIATLPDSDRDDLFELFPELVSDDAERKASAMRAFMEILEQPKGKITELVDAQASEDLAKWTGYVSAKIRQIRKAKGITQVQLTEATGIPQPHLSRLENGEHSPSFLTLEKIADALDIPVSELDPSA